MSIEQIHIFYSKWFNASAWYALALAREANRVGDNATLVGFEDTRLAVHAKDQNVPFVGVGKKNSFLGSFFSVVKLLFFIKKTGPKIVAVHYSNAYIVLAIIKRFFNPKWKLIRFRTDPRSLSTVVLSSWSYNQSDLIITSNKLIASNIYNSYKIPQEKIFTLYGGVDTNKFFIDLDKREKIRENLGVKKDQILIGSVGRVDLVKGHEILIEGYKILLQKNSDKYILLICASNDSEIEKIRDLINKTSPELQEKILIKGKQTNIASLIRAMDVGVVSSLGSEAICRVGMEMMACGVPIVSTDAGVLPEIIVDENRYDMYAPNDLADKLTSFKKEIKLYDQKEFYSEFKKIIKL